MINILSPEKDQLNDFYKMGSYAYSLAYMKQSGKVKTTDFICIPNDVCYSFLGNAKQYILQAMSDFKNEKRTAEEVSMYIKNIIQNIVFSQEALRDLSYNINTFLHALPEDKFEIKTILCWEDIDNNKCYYDNDITIDNNICYQDIVTSLLRAFGSVYSVNTLNRLKETNFRMSFPKNNIILLKKIYPDIYGTVIPYNPKDKIINESIIQANIGETIEVNEDMKEVYHYNMDDEQYYSNGLCEYELLSRIDIDKLMKQFRFLNEYLYQGKPVSIQYAVENDIVYVTNVMPYEIQKSDKNTLYINKYIEKPMRGVLAPLSMSYWKDLQLKVFSSTITNKLGAKDLLNQYTPLFNKGYLVYNNCLYMNPTMFSSFVAMLPYATSSTPIWVTKASLKDKNFENIDLPLSQSYLKNIKKLEKQIPTILKNKSLIYEKIKQLDDYFSKNYTKGMDYNQLVDLKNTLEKMYIECVDILPLLKSYSMFLSTQLINELTKLNIKEQTIKELINETLNTQENDMDKAIASLATSPMRNEIIAKVLRQITNREEYEMFISSNPNDPFVIEILSFMNKYGFINPYSNKFESITFFEDPTLLISMILYKYENPNKKTLLFDNIHLSRAILKKNVKEKYDNLKELSIVLNDLNYTTNKMFGYMKMIFMSMGSILVTKGIIQNNKDIFFIEINDLLSPNQNFNDTIIKNKNKYEMHTQIPHFKKIIFNNNGGQK